MACGSDDEGHSSNNVNIPSIQQNESENNNSNTTVADLSAPEHVKAEAQGSSSVYVSWDSVSGATSYIVYYRKHKLDETETYELNGSESSVSVSSTSTMISNLQSGSFYLFWVKAKNSSGIGKCSDFNYAETEKSSSSGSGSSSSTTETTISAPTGLSATASEKQLSISWNSVSGSEYYEVYICSSKTSNPVNNNLFKRSTDRTSYTTVSESAYFSFDTVYYIYVRAYKSGTFSSFASCSVTTEMKPDPNLKIINSTGDLWIKSVNLFTTTGNTRIAHPSASFVGTIKKNQSATFYVDTFVTFKQILFVTTDNEVYSYIGTFKAPSSGMKTITITDGKLEYIGIIGKY